MGQSFIQQAPDGSGKKVDTSVTNTTAQHRQVVSIGDPLIDGNIATVSAAGAQRTEIVSTTLQTYSSVAQALVPAALATDIVTIIGSATKLIKIKRIIISLTKTTAGSVTFKFLKYSTADTAGTSTTPTIVPHDSTNNAATAVMKAYTANPTLGTLVGTLNAKNVLVETPTSTTDFQGWDFLATVEVQPITLRGVNEQFSVNLNGVTVTGGSINITVIWTEE